MCKHKLLKNYFLHAFKIYSTYRSKFSNIDIYLVAKFLCVLWLTEL